MSGGSATSGVGPPLDPSPIDAPVNATAGTTRPSGSLGLKVLKRPPLRELRLREIIAWGMPRPGLDKGVAAWRFRNLPNLWRGLWRVLVARGLRIPHVYGAVYLERVYADGTRVQLGLASLRVVTDAGVAKIVALLNTSDATTGTTFKYHGFGTGTTAEAAGNTTLVTELTTEYATDNTRPTGTQTNNGANVYRTVATLTPDSGGTLAITEHGIFHQAANSGGTLLDRSKFSAVNLDSTAGDSLQATYDFTVNSGG
jgi:hypothetical protein